MSLLSVVIPSRDPRFLRQTVDDLFAKAAGEIEVIVTIDGYGPHPLTPRRGLTVLQHAQPHGMRAALNTARAAVRGQWVMKTDEHCLFAEGFDEQLKADCDGDWLLIPRRHSLDPERWCVEDNPKGPRDYHSLSCPVWSIREKDDYSMQGLEWPDRTRTRHYWPEYDVDETMSWQGSCYFMARRHYDWLGPLQEAGYGGFAQEPQEIGNKTWLGGGKLCVTKRTWYAHLHKGKKYGRGYRPNRTEIAAGHEWGAWYWMTDQWAARTHDMRWLVERFWPVPTWPADVLERWGDYFPPGATLEQLKAVALNG